MVANAIGSSGGGPASAEKPNKSLNGHKLLILTQWEPPEDYLKALRAEHSGLEIVYHKKEWQNNSLPDGMSPEDWKDVTILLVAGDLFPTREEAPKLQYIQLMSAGANTILKNPLFLDTDIDFCTANGVHGPQISEWLVGTWLAFQHHFPTYLKSQEEGKWQGRTLKVTDAVGQRVGILGYGSIGRQVARITTAMGFEVYAYNLHPRNTPESRKDESYVTPGLGDPDGKLPSKWFSGGSKEELHAFLASGLDWVVICLPLTDKTTHLFSAAEFEVLSAKKSFVSNIGRGPIIKTSDLIEALNNGLIQGAALDVTDPEPLPDGHELWSAKNIIITPHVSGSSIHYNDRVLAILKYNLERFSEGKKLTNRVSRKEGY